LQDFFAYASVPGVGEMAGWPHHKTIDTSQELLHGFLEEKEVLAVFHKAENKVIGSLGLHDSWAKESYPHLNSKEIGYVLSKEFWGQGIIVEAVKAVIDYGFSTLGIEAFTCGHFVENNQSRRVVEKIGFEFAKQSKYYSKQLDKTFDDMKYILFRDGKN
jgi:ribosomal-protein-alanine N-acetyltransferase